MPNLTANDPLAGGNGSDGLAGQDGDDTLNGGNDRDYLIGGPGADGLSGGDGYDIISYENSSTAVTVRLDFNIGSGGDATGDLIRDDVEAVVGSGLGDTLVGDGGSNALNGLQGNDILLGLGGPDVLIGGEGADGFAFYAADGATGVWDVITDFQDGIDIIALLGWNQPTLAIVQSGADAIITATDSGYSTGVIVTNTTVAQLADQVLLI